MSNWNFTPRHFGNKLLKFQKGFQWAVNRLENTMYCFGSNGFDACHWHQLKKKNNSVEFQCHQTNKESVKRLNQMSPPPKKKKQVKNRRYILQLKDKFKHYLCNYLPCTHTKPHTHMHSQNKHILCHDESALGSVLLGKSCVHNKLSSGFITTVRGKLKCL